MVRGRIAQQNGFALTTHEGFGDGHRLCRCLDHHHRGRNALQLGQGRGHLGQGLWPLCGLGDPRLLNRHRPVTQALIDLHHLATTPCGLANALGQQGLVFAHVGSHQQHTLKCGQRSHRGAQPTHRAVMLKVQGPQAGVDVVATHATHQLRGQMQLFSGAVRAGQQAPLLGAVIGIDLAQAIGDIFERRGPIHRQPFAVLLEHGLGQPIWAVECFVGEAIAVSDPALIDGLVFKRHHPHHLVVFHLHHQVGTCRIVGADRTATAEFPSACVVAKRLAGQGTHRADVDHVARQLRVHGGTNKGFNL